MRQQDSTVLMVFSLSAQAEAKTKAIFGKRKKELSFLLQDSLISQLKKLLRNVEIPVVWYNEDNQIGDTFGERYARAFQELYDQGYENVISIGNDCVSLTSEIIEDACTRLNDQQVIWGPAVDGGVYLLGLNKSVFELDKFQNLPWQTPELLKEFIESFDIKHRNTPSLPQLLDIDDVASLQRTIQSKEYSELSSILDQFLAAFTRLSFIFKAFALRFGYLFVGYLRGPPHRPFFILG